jgi:transcriptional regulator with XRE-family HTH domain
VKWVYREFGKRLRDARKQAGLSQEALADKVGFARTSITNIEKGRQHFTLHTAYELAIELGVDVSVLLPVRPGGPAGGGEITAKDRKKYKQVLQVPGAEDWMIRVIQAPTAKETKGNEESASTREDRNGASGETRD